MEFRSILGGMSKIYLLCVWKYQITRITKYSRCKPTSPLLIITTTNFLLLFSLVKCFLFPVIACFVFFMMLINIDCCDVSRAMNFLFYKGGLDGVWLRQWLFSALNPHKNVCSTLYKPSSISLQDHCCDHFVFLFFSDGTCISDQQHRRELGRHISFGTWKFVMYKTNKFLFGRGALCSYVSIQSREISSIFLKSDKITLVQ